MAPRTSIASRIQSHPSDDFGSAGATFAGAVLSPAFAVEAAGGTVFDFGRTLVRFASGGASATSTCAPSAFTSMITEWLGPSSRVAGSCGANRSPSIGGSSSTSIFFVEDRAHRASRRSSARPTSSRPTRVLPPRVRPRLLPRRSRGTLLPLGRFRFETVVTRRRTDLLQHRVLE